MASFLGIPYGASQTTDLTVISSTTLVNSQLILPIAANQNVQGFARVPINLAGALSGAKFQLTVPAGGVTFQQEYQIINGGTNAVATASILVASAAISNALANATNHYLFFTFRVTNGTTAGNITLQFAQLVSDAGAAKLLTGATIWGVRF